MSDPIAETIGAKLKNATDAFEVEGATLTLTTTDGDTLTFEAGDVEQARTTPTTTPSTEGGSEGGSDDVDIKARWNALDWGAFQKAAREYDVTTATTEGGRDAMTAKLVDMDATPGETPSTEGGSEGGSDDESEPAPVPKARDMSKLERGEIVEAVENGSLSGATAKNWFCSTGSDYHALKPCPADHDDTDGKVGVNLSDDGFAPLCASHMNPSDEVREGGFDVAFLGGKAQERFSGMVDGGMDVTKALDLAE